MKAATTSGWTPNTPETPTKLVPQAERPADRRLLSQNGKCVSGETLVTAVMSSDWQNSGVTQQRDPGWQQRPDT